MTKFSWVLALTLIASVAEAALPHMDLEMTSEEYRLLLAGLPKDVVADDPAIIQALRWGDRLSQWLQFENARRSPSEQLRLTSPELRTSIPISSPKIYSAQTVAADLLKLKAEVDSQIIATLDSSGAYPGSLPVSEADFVLQCRKVDKLYQTAARYKALLPYLSDMRSRAGQDVRAYYNMRTAGWDEARLSSFDSLSEADKAFVRTNLIGMCYNDGMSPAACQARVLRAESDHKMHLLFRSLNWTSSALWNEFFLIPGSGARRDIHPTNATTLVVPFRITEPRFMDYLRNNIEDEWQWNGWQLRLNFSKNAEPHLEFQTGALPHVNGLGGNTITMDANQPIEEYESQWIIRHEFGHVLGFPDCYHEFYDDNLKAFVNYQLDVTDLMCSRAGNMTERLMLELKRVYTH